MRLPELSITIRILLFLYKIFIMKITIVTVCFNSVKTIRDTIESVLAQNYPNIEYIVIDGGSNDGTLNIIHEYDERIGICISEPDEGIYDAMNKGIRSSSGDYIGILNSDDIFSHAHVISDIARLLSDRNVDGVYGDLILVNRNNTSEVVRSYSSKYFKKWKIRFGLMLPHPTFYVKRSLFDKLGYYKLNYRVSADFELITRFLTKGITLVRNPDVMVKMRQGGISSNGFWWRVHQNFEIIRACKENGIYTNIFLIAFKLPVKLLSYIK